MTAVRLWGNLYQVLKCVENLLIVREVLTLCITISLAHYMSYGLL